MLFEITVPSVRAIARVPKEPDNCHGVNWVAAEEPGPTCPLGEGRFLRQGVSYPLGQVMMLMASRPFLPLFKVQL